jgi:hypothetical protein
MSKKNQWLMRVEAEVAERTKHANTTHPVAFVKLRLDSGEMPESGQLESAAASTFGLSKKGGHVLGDVSRHKRVLVEGRIVTLFVARPIDDIMAKRLANSFESNLEKLVARDAAKKLHPSGNDSQFVNRTGGQRAGN